MPESLSKINPTCAYRLGAAIDRPSSYCPKLALAAGDVLAIWSTLEVSLSALFVDMLGENPQPGAVMFSSLTSTAAQTAAFRALAESTLSEDENDIFEGILSLYKSASKDRNKIAHWVWGHSDSIPEGILLCDPSVILRYRVALEKFQGADWPEWESLQSPTLDLDAVYVFKESDFNATHSLINHVDSLIVAFRSALNKSNSPESDQALQTICKEPQIATVVSRRQKHRKNAQEAPS